jgi:hypothetical protein
MAGVGSALLTRNAYRGGLVMEDDPRVVIGKFFVTKGMEEGRVWIGRESGDLAGEGGDFDQDALSALIEKFYEERF